MAIENKTSASHCPKWRQSELNYFFFDVTRLHSCDISKKNHIGAIWNTVKGAIFFKYYKHVIILHQVILKKM